MCWSCGCLMPAENHGDSRALTTLQLRGAAAQADADVPTVVSNIVRTLAYWRGRSRSAAKGLDEPELASCQVIKTSEERRYTLGVAYPANKPDVGKAADGFRDFAGPDALEEAAWKFMANGGRIGLDHADGTDGAGQVVESYVYRGPDWPQPNGYVVKAGDWLLGVIWPQDVFEGIKTGRWSGFSPQGTAKRRQPSPEALANLRY